MVRLVDAGARTSAPTSTMNSPSCSKPHSPPTIFLGPSLRAPRPALATKVATVPPADAVNRVLLCRILGIPLNRLWSFRQAPATLNLLEGPSADRVEVVRLNDCAHHTALFGEAVHRAL